MRCESGVTKMAKAQLYLNGKFFRELDAPDNLPDIAIHCKTGWRPALTRRQEGVERINANMREVLFVRQGDGYYYATLPESLERKIRASEEESGVKK